MSIASVITPDRVVLDLAVPNKHRVLYELSKKVGEALKLDPGQVFDAIMAREKLSSTGVGTATAFHMPA